MVFCTERESEGPTDKDAILRDYNTAAFSGGEDIREEQDIQNQVEMRIRYNIFCVICL